MDFYTRKRKAKVMINQLIKVGETEETIINAVEDAFEFSEKWTLKEINKIRRE